MIYVVLGMHKSGTTLVANMLHASGINMGESIDESVDYKRGNHYERRSTADINHRLLQGCLTRPWRHRAPAPSTDQTRHFPSLSRVRAMPATVRPDDDLMMREVIASCNAEHEHWGFKDPRTSLTYPLWRPRLGEHKVIAVYRGVASLVRHYRMHGLRQMNVLRVHRVLVTWMRYNEEVIRACTNPSTPTIVVSYERLMDDERERERLSAFVGRPLVDVRQASSPASGDAMPLVPWLVSRPLDRRLRDVERALDDLRRQSIERVA